MKEKMKEKELTEKLVELLREYKELLGQCGEIQRKLRALRNKTSQIAKVNLNLESFAWLVISLNADYFEKTNNLDFSKDEERIASRLELLSKNQNLKEKGDKNEKRIDKDK